LESARRSHVNQFLGPEPQVYGRATSKQAQGSPVQVGDKLGSYVFLKASWAAASFLG
jgi:hypothetical protein